MPSLDLIYKNELFKSLISAHLIFLSPLSLGICKGKGNPFELPCELINSHLKFPNGKVIFTLQGLHISIPFLCPVITFISVMVIKIKLLTNLFLELTKIMCANGSVLHAVENCVGSCFGFQLSCRCC
jgi:hypothetical protein